MPERYPGFFGKLPAHGDFIDRGLPRSFINPWDQWLQGCIANSRELLGTGWLDRYLVGPIWRFALAPGVCGEAGWRGLLLPSVDRVNRYYPITIAMAEAADVSPLAALSCCNNWFTACEDAALAALDPNVDADTLAERLRGIGAMDPQRVGIGCPRFHAEGASAWHLELSTPQVGPELDAVIAEALMQKDYPACSLWWSAGSEAIDPSLLIHRGLPSIHDFVALLDGHWRQWGWASCATAAPLAEIRVPTSAPDHPSTPPPDPAGVAPTDAPDEAAGPTPPDMAHPQASAGDARTTHQAPPVEDEKP
jgi:type VI secretion system protein ImpM